MKTGTPIEIIYNEGTVRKYPSIKDAALSLDVSPTYIQSFIQKKRPKEIIDIRKIKRE